MTNFIDYVQDGQLPFIVNHFKKLQKLTEKTLDEYLELYKEADYLSQVPYLWSIKMMKLNIEFSADTKEGLNMFRFLINSICDKLIPISDIPNMFDGFGINEPDFILNYLKKNINEEFIKRYSKLSDCNALLNKESSNILKLDIDSNLRVDENAKIPVITLYMCDKSRTPFDLTKKDIEIFSFILNNSISDCEKYVK